MYGFHVGKYTIHRYHGNLVVWDSQVGVIFHDPCSFLYSDVFPAFPQWLFLVPLNDGRDYKWYILPIGGLYATYHLLGEPETTIDFHFIKFIQKVADSWSRFISGICRFMKTIAFTGISTKLCPLVGSGILYRDHPKDYSSFG